MFFVDGQGRRWTFHADDATLRRIAGLTSVDLRAVASGAAEFPEHATTTTTYVLWLAVEQFARAAGIGRANFEDAIQDAAIRAAAVAELLQSITTPDAPADEPSGRRATVFR